MATTEKSLDEYLTQLSEESLGESHFKWTSEPIEAFPSYTVSMGGAGGASGTLDPSYGAVPNVVIGGGIYTTSATGVNVTTPIWTTGSGSGANIGPTWTTTNTNPYTVMGAGGAVGGGKLSLKGAGADIDIDGKSLVTWMEKVEERLNILTPNPELEKEWDQLRRLGERYRKLEKKCKEQSDMWNKLKNMPKPNIT